jgi:hypothetical protein
LIVGALAVIGAIDVAGMALEASAESIRRYGVLGTALIWWGGRL